MPGAQVIVNADDLGISPQVNDSVFKLMELGLITSATLIANAPHLEEACQRIGDFPGRSFGVHLNVTEFSPLSAPEKLAGLLDGQGIFEAHRIRRVSLDSTLAEGIFQEFGAQIERLRSLGVALSHIDSHHDIHTIPGVFPILKRVQKQFQIRRVRLSRNMYTRRDSPGKRLLMKKALYNFLLRHYVRTKTTQRFGEFKAFHELATTGKLKGRTFEVMVHPGSQAFDYEDETELLRSPWREALGFPIRLVSYLDLG